jgi:hypothetical protein
MDTPNTTVHLKPSRSSERLRRTSYTSTNVDRVDMTSIRWASVALDVGRLKPLGRTLAASMDTSVAPNICFVPSEKYAKGVQTGSSYAGTIKDKAAASESSCTCSPLPVKYTLYV